MTDTDPAKARSISNAIREAAAQHIMSVTEVQAVNTVDEANLPTEPSDPSIRKWTAIGAALGMLLCAMILVVRFLLDDTIKTSEDVEKYLGWSTLALIPTIEENLERRKVSKKAPVQSNKEDMGKRQDRDKDYRQAEKKAETKRQSEKNVKVQEDKKSQEKIDHSAEEQQEILKGKGQGSEKAE